ncbi:MAG: hypothetical protein M0R46_08605 [Candidatus Muirbacterium halophilum]|nr:hypothetical protein [Candidatus Muirbacterium halophilum]MCK9475965.1 hypothetical protein [Candidatus Muirbacterium halophilum]
MNTNDPVILRNIICENLYENMLLNYSLNNNVKLDKKFSDKIPMKYRNLTRKIILGISLSYFINANKINLVTDETFIKYSNNIDIVKESITDELENNQELAAFFVSFTDSLKINDIKTIFLNDILFEGRGFWQAVTEGVVEGAKEGAAWGALIGGAAGAIGGTIVGGPVLGQQTATGGAQAGGATGGAAGAAVGGISAGAGWVVGTIESSDYQGEAPHGHPGLQRKGDL